MAKQVFPMATDLQSMVVETDQSSAEPVLAELVPATPPPWQFGMRAVLALMVVCSVQFALMNWFGVIGGLLLSIAICFLSFSAIFLVAVLLVRGNSVWLDRLDQIGIRLVLAMLVLILGTVLAGGGKVAVDQVSSIIIRRSMQADLGFVTERVYVVDNSEAVFALEVTGVTSGGVADKAGLHEHDVILVPDGSISRFFQDLNKQRGKDFDINIAGAAANQPLEKCPQWVLTLPIPAN
jgi:hypothetical protein